MTEIIALIIKCWIHKLLFLSYYNIILIFFQKKASNHRIMALFTKFFFITYDKANFLTSFTIFDLHCCLISRETCGYYILLSFSLIKLYSFITFIDKIQLRLLQFATLSTFVNITVPSNEQLPN